MEKLKDQDIRKVLIERLTDIYKTEEETRIVNEMGILHGQSRIDVAVINGILHGFEIKSESDTLERLPSQITDYNKVFDRVTIVVQKQHLDGVKSLVPKWWGIWLLNANNKNTNLKIIRKGRKNKGIDPYSLAQLLWKEEALTSLKEKGLHRGYLSKPKYEIYNRIVDTYTLDEIRQVVSQSLRNRENWLIH